VVVALEVQAAVAVVVLLQHSLVNIMRMLQVALPLQSMPNQMVAQDMMILR
jgi:hypothetical protein